MHKNMLQLAVALHTVILLLINSSLYASPPTNDDLANASIVYGVQTGAFVQTNEATAEIGENAHAGHAASKSVWWAWTSPVTGSVAVSTYPSEFDTLLAVYTGSSYPLTEVASDDDGEVFGGTSSLMFNAVSGTTYYIALDGKSGASGNA